MRIPSGKIDITLYFMAVDSSDLITPKTGLSAFTVYRSRNGGTATVYTTPTIVELSAANMPGLYSLLIDEDTSIASTSDAEEYAVRITCATMAPVTRVLELFRRDTTSGQTITVASGAVSSVTTVTGNVNGSVGSVTGNVAGSVASVTGNVAGSVASVTGNVGGNVTGSVGSIAAGGITAASFAAGAITAAKFAANALDAVWSTATRLLTAGTNIVLAKGTGITGFNDLDAPGVRAAIGMASANLDTQLATFATAANLTVVNNNVLATYNRIGAPVSATISTDLQAIAASITSTPTSILDAPNGIETGVTLRKGLRAMLSVLNGKVSGLGTPNPVFRDFNDTKDRISPTVDQWGNRSAITSDLD